MAGTMYAALLKKCLRETRAAYFLSCRSAPTRRTLSLRHTPKLSLEMAATYWYIRLLAWCLSSLRVYEFTRPTRVHSSYDIARRQYRAEMQTNLFRLSGDRIN